MILFFYYSRSKIDEQKKNIETHDQIMINTKKLVHTIDSAQQDVNFYIATKQISHLDSFHLQLTRIEEQIDTFKNTHDSIPVALFEELKLLLKMKGETVAELSKLLREQQAIPSRIRERLSTHESIIESDSLEVNTHSKDTIIKSESKRQNIWQKIGSIFSSKQATDTIMAVSKELLNTKITPNDTSYITSKQETSIENSNFNFANYIISIEERVIQLILSDQEISSGISNLLIDLYDDLLYSRLDEIEGNELWLRKNNTISIIIGSVALFLILLFIIFIISDVNKGLRMRKSLEIANERIKQIMESRHKLLLSVSHDIKTPLNSIVGYLELNNDQNQLTIHDLSSMRNSGRYILALLENLLEFSSLQLGTLTATQNVFSIVKLCDEIKEMFTPLIRQKGLTFNYIYEFENDLYINSDSLKLRQIIINILSNAVKYTSSGSIEFTARFENEQLFIQVSDTGIGIPQEQIDKIFQPFTRIDENKNVAEGTGFGMYVVKGLTNLLGGTINVDSVVNNGTTISVNIPIMATLIENKEISPLKIYVIDDDPAFSNLLIKMLSQLGHEVTSSNTYSHFEQNKQQISASDMVMTDMEMGNTSGIDILKEIREFAPLLPVFVITGRSNFSQEQAHTLGFNGYLPKPVTLNELTILTKQTRSGDNCIKSLQEMFGDDEKAIQEIIDIFIHTTNENLNQLEYFIKENAFSEAQAICHKMLPMFLQMGQDHIAEYLKKMNQSRGEPAENHPLWKKDGAIFIKKANEMLKEIMVHRGSKES